MKKLAFMLTLLLVVGSNPAQSQRGFKRLAPCRARKKNPLTLVNVRGFRGYLRMSSKPTRDSPICGLLDQHYLADCLESAAGLHVDHVNASRS